MIPWSIALLVVGYTVVAASSTVTVYRVMSGWLEHPLLWPALWSVLSTTLAIGLALLRPWARTLAVWSSVLMALSALGAAWMAIAQSHPEPLRSVFATGMAGVQLVVIRYLTRPWVKAWFIRPSQDARRKAKDLSLES